MTLSSSELTTELLALKRRCKCNKIRVIEVDDVEIDATKRNTIQTLSNGEVWFVACDGQTVLLGGTGGPVTCEDVLTCLGIDPGSGDGDLFLNDQGDFVAIPASHDPVTLNADQPTQDSANLVGQELQLNPVTDTTYGVMSPADKAKLDDLTGLERTITVVANYAALPAPATVPDEFYFAEASQGTSWLPGSLGGTYRPAGLYYSTGAAWITDISPWQATQADVDAGIITDQFVSPATLANAAQWGTKQDAISFGADNQIPYTNAAGDDFDYSANLTFTGTALSVDNSTAVFNESGVDVDFRVEGVGQPNALFVDGANGRVGIGTATPGVKFEVNSGNTASGFRVGDSSLSRFITMGYANAVNLFSPSIATVVGFISGPSNQLQINSNFSINAGSIGVPALIIEGASGIASDYLQIRPDVATSGTILTVNSSGDVGIGLASPQTNLHIQESNTDTIPAFELEQLSTGDAALQFSIPGDSFALGIDNSDSDLFKISYAAAEGTAVLGTNDLLTIAPTGEAVFSSTVRLKGYTVATLPAGVVGDTAYCTDLTAPTYLGVAVGGGAVVAKVFFDGTNWIT